MRYEPTVPKEVVGTSIYNGNIYAFVSAHLRPKETTKMGRNFWLMSSLKSTSGKCLEAPKIICLHHEQQLVYTKTFLFIFYFA